MAESEFKKLDKSIFNQKLDVLALKIPSRKTQEFRKRLGDWLLQKQRLSSIVPIPGDNTKRLILLKESVTEKSLEQLPEDLRRWVLDQEDVEVVNHSLTLDYNYFTANEILSRILPQGSEIPSAFEQVGHLIHLNLRDELLPYKYVIGQVLLDKIPTCKTVVNKVGKIDTVFRTFDMELLAGEDNTVVSLKEENCIFEFDYRKVYWNSRLQHEHARLVATFAKTDVVADMFCGIGPFVLPAAKKGCVVYGNDLNPCCFEYLNKNLKLNKLEKNVKTFNLDAREFITQIAKDDIPITQIVMNLPVSAELFCDVFRSCFSNFSHPLPMVHCYMFSAAEDPVRDSIHRLEGILKASLSSETTEGRLIRDVGPKKMMTLVSFRLTEDMIDRCNKREKDVEGEEGEGKRLKVWIVCIEIIVIIMII